MFSVIDKKFRFIILSLFIVLSFLMVAQVGLAGDEKTGAKKATEGLDMTATGGFGTAITTNNADLSTVIGKIVGAALSFLGVVFFILIIYGGYMWMFSMGNEQTAGKAKEIIVAAV
ncbi:MAG: hypothetical protein Q8O59_04250, partial [bacterium]|nr:hypothetical protein [bacterium]